MKPVLTEKQKRFIDYYVETGNATEAARKAGYSEKTSYSIGHENLKKPEIKSAIDARLKELEEMRVADAREVLIHLTAAMRGEIVEYVPVVEGMGDGVSRARLLEKPLSAHDRLEAVIFTPTDWHLLRKCPSPVWMVKDQPWPEGGKALVAVNLASEEPYHNALNEKLVKETIELAEQVNHTEVHLVGAYPVTPINIAIELPEFDPSVYNDAIRGQHLLAMKALRQKFGINENMTHVEKGLPEEVIPDLAEHLQAGIVVLGTVGRTGISAAFLGNTAEQVIDHLRCDLLVIKPDQYQTPVELDDEEDD